MNALDAAAERMRAWWFWPWWWRTYWREHEGYPRSKWKA